MPVFGNFGVAAAIAGAGARMVGTTGAETTIGAASSVGV